MKRQVAWILFAVFAAALLAACDNDDGSTSAPGSVMTPTPVLEAEGTPAAEQPAFRETALLSADDVRAAAYNPDGSFLALSSGSSIWLFTPDLAQVRELKGHTAPVRALAWSPDGTQLASAALDNTARIWDVESGNLLTTLSGHTNWVMDVDWSPDGTRLVTAGSDHSLRLWDAATGAELIELGANRVESIVVTFNDDGIFDAIAEMNYAETILDDISSEPLSALVEKIIVQDYRVAVAFDDPATVERLLKLNGGPYQVQISVDDAALTEQLATLSNDELIDVAVMLDDEQITALLADYSAAEAEVAAINARADADMIRTVQRLKNQEIVLVIQQADGSTTTANPATDDFIATLADMEGDDVTISFGIENGTEIAAALQDPDFVAAVQQYDTAQATLSALTERDDAVLLLLVRELQASDYTLTLSNGNEELDTALSALDNAATIHLISLLHNPDLLATLEQLAAVDFVVSDLGTYSISELSGVLAPLDHYVVITTDDAALNEEIAGESRQDIAKLADLINSVVLRYALDHAAEAQATLDELTTRDDYALITTLRKLENARTIETIISVPSDSDEVRVTLKHNTADYVLTLALTDENAIKDMSALSNEALIEQFTAQDIASLNAQIKAGVYTLTPALEADDLAVLMGYLPTDMLTVSVQRETNAHLDSVIGVAWSASGNIIASTSTDLSVRLWEPDSGILAATFELDDSGIALAWSPDGTLLANGGWTDSVILWDAREGAANAEEFAELKGDEHRILALAWSPDGAQIAGGTADGMVIVWDVASGDEVLSFTAHAGETRAVAWTPDGSAIFSAGTDGYARLWPVENAASE